MIAVNSLVIREPRTEDIPSAFKFCKSFHQEVASGSGFRFDDRDALDVMAYFAEGNGLCLVAELEGELVGVICGTVTPYAMCTSQLVFKEVFWYVLPEYRGRIGQELYQAMIKECALNDIEVILMAAQDSHMRSPIERFYKHSGLRKLESTWIKVI